MDARVTLDGAACRSPTTVPRRVLESKLRARTARIHAREAERSHDPVLTVA
jgi:hypothetical protein